MNQMIAAVCPSDTHTSFELHRHAAGISSYLLALLLWSVCTAGILLCSPDLARAQIETEELFVPSIEDVTTGSELRVRFGFERRFETNIDDGGEVDEWRLHMGIRPKFRLSRQWRVSLNVNYIYEHYGFSGTVGFGALKPWEHLHFIKIVVPLTYSYSERWDFSVSPFFLISTESGADLSQSIAGGAFVTARYSFSKNFALGLAVGGRTRIEDDPKFVLFPLIRWKFRLFRGSGDGNSSSRGLTLVSFAGPMRGGGGVLRYNWGSNWTVGIGGSAQSKRFRLDDDGVAPEGVGEASSRPVWAHITYKLRDFLRVEVYGGAALSGKLELEDRNGREIIETDVDPAPILGVTVTGSF